ncbi:class II fructose-bisphosphatase [soil metagenome]
MASPTITMDRTTRRIAAMLPDLLRATQDAALACRPFVGRGDCCAADAAAVAALRQSLGGCPGTGTVVAGEGEKDAAPMLCLGESVGAGGPPMFDLAVDPLENTTACARASEGAIAVVATAPGGTMWSSPAWYVDKLVVPAEAADAVDIRWPVERLVAAVAECRTKAVTDLVAVVLDKPRHVELVGRLRACGVAVALIADGDILGALRVVLPDGDADLLVGIGGAPEAVITACSVQVLGGGMQIRLAPQSPAESARIAGPADAVLGLDQMVASDDCAVAMTGITSCGLLDAPVRSPDGWTTHSLGLASGQPVQRITAHHVIPNPPRDPQRSVRCLTS